MPRENKKRGRRGQNNKRKLEEDLAATEAENIAESSKRVKLHEETSADHDYLAENRDFEPLDNHYHAEEAPFQESEAVTDRPYYGTLSEDEQEYFRRTDEMLELDDFAAPSDRELFLDNVFKEADGKELKMACSQSCSRLMEKLIHLSTPAQLSSLFQKFNGQ